MPCVPVSPLSGVIRRFRVLAWLGLASVAAFSLDGAESAARSRFDLPAGTALVTLKRAALQGELEIVYSAALVEGVETQAVAGEYTPLEALERMLAGTPLRILQDAGTKVLSVTRRPDPDPRPPSHSSPPKEPREP